MRLCTVEIAGREHPAVKTGDDEWVLVDGVLGRDIDLGTVIADGLVDAVRSSIGGDVAAHTVTGAREVVPYRHPRKIFGIGLNYRAHAGDLGEDAPRTTPASFLKGDHTIIGPGEAIRLPDIGRVTAEAELGLVIGRHCHKVDIADALDHVVGICAILDQTAEEILLENPRYLTRTKNYPTFFSFGPHIITMDEVAATVDDLADLRVATIHNGSVHRDDVVANMTFSPAELLAFHSHVMPFFPGDILSTGTPGAVAISPGDVVRCEIDGDFASLENPVEAER